MAKDNTEYSQLTLPGTTQMPGIDKLGPGIVASAMMQTLDGETVAYKVAEKDLSQFTERPRLWDEPTVITRDTDGTLLVSEIIGMKRIPISLPQYQGKISLERLAITCYVREEKRQEKLRRQSLEKINPHLAS